MQCWGSIAGKKKTSVNKSHSVIVVEKSYDRRAKRWNMKIAYHTNDTEPVDLERFHGENMVLRREKR